MRQGADKSKVNSGETPSDAIEYRGARLLGELIGKSFSNQALTLGPIVILVKKNQRIGIGKASQLNSLSGRKFSPLS